MMTKYMEYRTIKDNLTIAFGKIVKEKKIKIFYCDDNFTNHGWGGLMTYATWTRGKKKAKDNKEKSCSFKIVKHDTIPEKIKSLMFIQEI